MRLMAEKRKSAFKHPDWHRRNRSSTPALDLLSPYLPGPELFISPPMSIIQTRPVYSTTRYNSSLSSVSSSLIGYSPFANPMATPDSNLIPSNSGSFSMSPVLLKISQLDRQHSLFSTTDRLVWAFKAQYFIHDS